MPNVFFSLVTNIVEAPMKSLALLEIYLLNQGLLDFVLKIC